MSWLRDGSAGPAAVEAVQPRRTARGRSGDPGGHRRRHARAQTCHRPPPRLASR